MKGVREGRSFVKKPLKTGPCFQTTEFGRVLNGKKGLRNQGAILSVLFGNVDCDQYVTLLEKKRFGGQRVRQNFVQITTISLVFHVQYVWVPVKD